MDVVIVFSLIVGLLVLFDAAALAFGADSREAFADPSARPTIAIR